MSVNKIILLGRVGKDPEVKRFDGGSVQARCSIATSEKYKDKAGKQTEETQWHNLIFWGALAELAEKYVEKGSQLYVEGKVKYRDWEDKEGNKRYTTEINVTNMTFVGSKPSGDAAKPAPAPAAPEEDLPF
jgi:single-strand DNA-binding protein